ncbi:uncharacterized protein LOC116257377 isoform X1 [Nymphaea colorata]|nr:uncharacterized protein LOC116257377 isoform X1 [Nymphaea colorata]
MIWKSFSPGTRCLLLSLSGILNGKLAMMSVIPIESGVCVRPADPYGCGGSSVGMNGAGDSDYFDDAGDSFAGISGGGEERPAIEGIGPRMGAGASGIGSFPEDDADVAKGSDYNRVFSGEPNVGIGQDRYVEKDKEMPIARSSGEANVTANNEGSGDCGGLLVMRNEYGVPLISPEESNVDEACCSLGTTSRPCEEINGELHENVVYRGNQFGNDCPSAHCDVLKDQSTSDCQISIVQRHAENQSHCSWTMEGTCQEKTEPVQANGASKPSPYNESMITVEGSNEFSKLTLMERECGGSTLSSKHNLLGSQICTSEITEEFSVDEAEISQANAYSLVGCPQEHSYTIDDEGVNNSGHTLAEQKTCGESLDVSADSHMGQQLGTSEMTKDPCEEEEYISMEFFRDPAHCQEHNVVLETGSAESSKKMALEKECGASAPVCDKIVTVESLCSLAFIKEQVKSAVVNTCRCGGGSIVAGIDAVDGLPRETKIGLEERAPTESDSEKTLCSSGITQETYQGRTMLHQDISSYDADYCRESVGQIEEAVDSNKLPYEEKKISTLSVGYSPETASYDPAEGSGSPPSRLSMSHQTDTDGIITSTCGSSILPSILPLSCDNSSCVQDKKSLKSKRVERAYSSKAVPSRKSTRLTKTRNVSENGRQACSSKMVPDIIHVLFSKMARGKRSGLRKPISVSCWGALENLQLFKQNGIPLDSDPCLAIEKGADSEVLKISKRSTSNGRRRTKGRPNANRQVKRKGSLPVVIEKLSATGKNTCKGESLPNEECSNSLNEFGGSGITDLEPEPAEHVLSCKAAEEKLGSADTFACLSVHHAQCGGEDNESAVAQITSSEKSSQVCQGYSSEACVDEVQTKHSETSLCTSQTDPPCNGGMPVPVSFSVATGKNSEVQLVPSHIRTASTLCEGACSVDLEKASLSTKEPAVHGDPPDVVSTSSKVGVLEGIPLPLHTYSKKRKREPKARGRLNNSGEATEAERILDEQLKQKASKKQSKQKSKKADSLKKQSKQKSKKGDNQECLKNIPVVRKRRARKKNQAEASTDDRLADKALISCHIDEKGVNDSLHEGMKKDSPTSCGVPSKGDLSEECAAEAFQTLEKHNPKRLLKKKKDGSKKCRPNSSAPARHRKMENHEKGKVRTKKASKSDGVVRARLVKTFDKGKAKNAVITETGSKTSSSEAATECDDRFHGKASSCGLHPCVGDAVSVDNKISFVTINHESGGSSAPPRQAWVLCDDCHKWRSIPAELADSIGDTDCSWTCKDNADKRFADCSIPQEKSNAEINAELNISEASCDEDFPSTQPHASSYESPQLQVPQQDTWTLIKHNIFLHRNHKHQNIDEIMVCQCKPPQSGGQGCGDGCLNRLLNIECEHGTCPCGELCSNQQFQNHKYATFEWVRCGKKGYGLQLREDVSKGQFLIEYVGEVLDTQTYAARQREYAARGQRHFYFMTLNGNEVIDACAKGNLGRFINHSCDPNCRTEKWIVNGEVCIGLFALRDIKKGEEVTFDYNYVRVFGAAAKKCFCGSPGCRGYIGGDPLNTEVVIESDSEEAFPEPVMIQEDVGNEQLKVEMFDSKVPAVARVPTNSTVETMGTKDALSGPSTSTSLETSETNAILPRLATPSEAAYAKDVAPDLPKDASSTSADIKDKLLQLPAQGSTAIKKSRLVFLKSSGTVKKTKHGNSQGRSSKPKRILIVADRHRFEGVEEKLNELLDVDGGICKRKDAAKGYLKLLFITASSGDVVNGASPQSTRDLSIILDALLKTKSRTVLLDIVNKNGLQMLHNIMKQNRKNFNKIPIIRKLLKVLEFLASREVLTLEHVNSGPPCTGMESFRESIMALTRHNDVQVHQMARGFRDKYIPHTIRKIKCTDRDDASSHWIRFSHRNWQSQARRHTDAICCTSSQATELPSDFHKTVQTSSVTVQSGLSESNKCWEDYTSEQTDEPSSSMWRKRNWQGQLSTESEASSLAGLPPGSSNCQQTRLPDGLHSPAQTYFPSVHCSSMCCQDTVDKNGCKSTEQKQPDVAAPVQAKRAKRKSRWEPLDETRARLFYINQNEVQIVEKNLNNQRSGAKQAKDFKQPAPAHGKENDYKSSFVKTVAQSDSVFSEAAQSLAKEAPDVRPSDESHGCQFPSNHSSSEVNFQQPCNTMATVCGKRSSHLSPSYSSELPQTQHLQVQQNQPNSTSYANWSAPSMPFQCSPPLPLDTSALHQTGNDLVPPGFEGMRQSSQMPLPRLEPAKPSDAADTCASQPLAGVGNCGKDSVGRRPFFHQRWNSRGYQKHRPPWVRNRNDWGFKGNPRNIVGDGFGAYEVPVRQMGPGGDGDGHPPETVNKSHGSIYSHHQDDLHQQEAHRHYHEKQQQQQYPCHSQQLPQPYLHSHQHQLQQH